jgi:acetaldehyde dehydrogenase (acetylating)
MSDNNKLRVAIIGTGKIGIDLLHKVRRSKNLSCLLVVGRNADSPGLAIAEKLGVPVSAEGIGAIVKNIDSLDVVFDATSASAHIKHWGLLKTFNIGVIDMTPSGLGQSIVPAVNLLLSESSRHANMISCGGQSSVPIVHAISQVVQSIDYVELVSSIASKSAGAATRVNLDEYIENTEKAILEFSGAGRSKVILILNPAEPPVNMQTTISFQIENPPMREIIAAVKARVEEVRKYVPGYELLIEPTQIEENRVVVMMKVEGAGDYLPKYAGNLDIINCAAVAVAESMSVVRVN